MSYAMFSCLDLHFYMLIFLQLHVLGFMPCFPMFFASFSSRLMIRVTCSHDCLMLLAKLCQIYVFMHFFPCFLLRSTSIHVYMLGFMFYHVYVLSFYMFTCMFLCLYAYIYVSTCLRFPCACALYAMFMCLDLGYVCHAMCYCSPFITSSFFPMFWPIGSNPI